MENKITFGKWEAICVMITMLGTKVILNFPRVVAEFAGTAAWMLIIYITVLTLLCFMIIQKLYSKFEGKDLLDIGEIAGGRAGKVITGCIIMAFFIYIVSVILRQFSEQMITMSFTDTPISIITILFLIGMMYGAYLGIETLARFQGVLVPFSIINFTIYIILLIPNYEVTNIFPIFGNGIQKILLGGLLNISDYSELLALFIIIPFIKTKDNFRRTGFISIIATAYFMLSLSLAYTLAIPYPVTEESFLPVYTLGRLVNYGRFFQRIEPLFLITWAAIGFMYLSTGFWFIVYIFQKTFGLKHYRPMIIPFAVLIMNLSLMPPSLMASVNVLLNVFRKYSWMVTFAMTIVLLVIARLRKRKRRAGVHRC